MSERDRPDRTDRAERERGDEERPRLFGLMRKLPELLSRLVRDEVEAAKAEISRKLKEVGKGAGVAAAGGVVVLFAIGTLIAAAVLGLAVALPPWLAALLIGVVLLAGGAVMLLVGVRMLRRGAPPTPTETAEDIKKDVRVVTRADR